MWPIYSYSLEHIQTLRGQPLKENWVLTHSLSWHKPSTLKKLHYSIPSQFLRVSSTTSHLDCFFFWKGRQERERYFYRSIPVCLILNCESTVIIPLQKQLPCLLHLAASRMMDFHVVFSHKPQHDFRQLHRSWISTRLLGCLFTQIKVTKTEVSIRY